VSGDAASIAALYASDARYASAPFSQPLVGRDAALSYVTRVLGEESEVEARFGEPICDGDRAAVQWWASFVEDRQLTTLGGTSVLRFDNDGMVVDEWDAWNQTDGRVQPPAEWGQR
jgi:predicted SnoaL-like aldol condensation-catalyzing enzyme